MGHSRAMGHSRILLESAVKKLLMVLALALAAFGGGIILTSGLMAQSGVSKESRDRQIVQAIEREQQVVLLTLGIQGIAEERVASTLFGVDVPGSGRAQSLQYGFRAKLGIDGADVVVQTQDEDSILVSVPEFQFIGHSDVTFQTALASDGLISWFTPSIDTAEVVTNILSNEAQDEYLASNQDTLREQAAAFYTSIILAVDPDMEVTVEFMGGPPGSEVHSDQSGDLESERGR